MDSLTAMAARATAQYIMIVENELRHLYTRGTFMSAGKYLNYDKVPDQILRLVVVHFMERDQEYHFGQTIKSPREHKITLTVKKSIKLITTDHIDYAELYTHWGALVDRCVPELQAGVYHLKFLRGAPIHNGIASDFYIIVGTTDQNPPSITADKINKNLTYEKAFLGSSGYYVQRIERTMCIERRENFLLFDPHVVTVRRYDT